MIKNTPFPYELIEIAKREEDKYHHQFIVDNFNNVTNHLHFKVIQKKVNWGHKKLKDGWTLEQSVDFGTTSDIGLDLKMLEEIKKELNI